MKYLLNGIKIDSILFISDIEKGHILNVLKHFVEITGSSLADAKILYDSIIKDEKININSVALEMQAYCQAELDEIE